MEPIRVWISEFALTHGLIEAEGMLHASDHRYPRKLDRVWVSADNLPEGDLPRVAWNNHPFLLTVTCHETRSEAVARAEVMRKAKVSALRKRVSALVALRFEPEGSN